MVLVHISRFQQVLGLFTLQAASDAAKVSIASIPSDQHHVHSAGKVPPVVYMQPGPCLQSLSACQETVSVNNEQFLYSTNPTAVTRTILLYLRWAAVEGISKCC